MIQSARHAARMGRRETQTASLRNGDKYCELDGSKHFRNL